VDHGAPPPPPQRPKRDTPAAVAAIEYPCPPRDRLEVRHPPPHPPADGNISARSNGKSSRRSAGKFRGAPPRETNCPHFRSHKKCECKKRCVVGLHQYEQGRNHPAPNTHTALLAKRRWRCLPARWGPAIIARSLNGTKRGAARGFPALNLAPPKPAHTPRMALKQSGCSHVQERLRLFFCGREIDAPEIVMFHVFVRAAVWFTNRPEHKQEKGPRG